MTVRTVPSASPVLLAMDQVRAMLGNIGRDRVYDLDARGEITSTKIGSRRYWFADSVTAYAERLRDLGPMR